MYSYKPVCDQYFQRWRKDHQPYQFPTESPDLLKIETIDGRRRIASRVFELVSYLPECIAGQKLREQVQAIVTRLQQPYLEALQKLPENYLRTSSEVKFTGFSGSFQPWPSHTIFMLDTPVITPASGMFHLHACQATPEILQQFETLRTTSNALANKYTDLSQQIHKTAENTRNFRRQREELHALSPQYATAFDVAFNLRYILASYSYDLNTFVAFTEEVPHAAAA